MAGPSSLSVLHVPQAVNMMHFTSLCPPTFIMACGVSWSPSPAHVAASHHCTAAVVTTKQSCFVFIRPC